MPFTVTARRTAVAVTAGGTAVIVAARRTPVAIAARSITFAIAARSAAFSVAAGRTPVAIAALRASATAEAPPIVIVVAGEARGFLRHFIWRLPSPARRENLGKVIQTHLAGGIRSFVLFVAHGFIRN